MFGEGNVLLRMFMHVNIKNEVQCRYFGGLQSLLFEHFLGGASSEAPQLSIQRIGDGVRPTFCVATVREKPFPFRERWRRPHAQI